MSIAQVKAFIAKVKEDQALAKKLQDAEAAYTGDTSDKEAAFAAVVIPVAAEAGFKFTVEDYKAAFEAEGEASETELDAVAGGKFGEVYFCVFGNFNPDEPRTYTGFGKSEKFF